MEGMLSANEKQNMVSSFLEIAVGQTAETATQFLQATSWKLEEALQLFYIGNDGGPVASASHSPPTENAGSWADENVGEVKDHENKNAGQDVGVDVRAPLPVLRDTLYDDAMLYRMGYPQNESSSLIAFRNFDEEMKRPGVWESDQGAPSTTENARDNLASLYSPPYHLMFQGSFEKAKGAASVDDKWLLVNLQSTKEFSSHMLNRDTWANEAVAQTISANFIFWQVYDDTSEGRKVCTYYKLGSIPVVLVIDPITGQKMRAWNGMIQPESLLEDLVPFMDGGPREHHLTLSHKRPRGSSQAPQKNKASSDAANKEDGEVQQTTSASMDSTRDSNALASANKDANAAEKEDETCSIKKPTYPVLPEEPKGNSSLTCRVGLRLPDGRRVQRHFLKTDPIQLNRDAWANETVAQIICAIFIFWQVYDDTSEGRKVCTYYKLGSTPVVLLIDPITGLNIRAWNGMIQPESLLEDLVPFMDGGPREYHLTLLHTRPRGSSQAPQKNKASNDAANKEDEEVQQTMSASMDSTRDSNALASANKDATAAEKEDETCSMEKPTYPVLPEEPKGNSSLTCRVALRLPDGRRVQRHFLKSDPIQLLWSFCISQLKDAGRRLFRLTQAIPGAKTLNYETEMTFGESGLANSMMSVA